MTRRPRRNHTSAFKSKVALEALRGEHSLGELGRKYDVHANQIKQWRDQFLESAPDVFERQSKSVKAEPSTDVKTLHAKIGELTLEHDFLESALTNAGLQSAKKW
jgi:transposase